MTGRKNFCKPTEGYYMGRKTPIAKVGWRWGSFEPYIWNWTINKLKTSVNFVIRVEIISISDFFRKKQREKIGLHTADTVWWWSFSWSNLCKSRATDNFYSVKFCVQTDHTRSNYKCFSEKNIGKDWTTNEKNCVTA